QRLRAQRPTVDSPVSLNPIARHKSLMSCLRLSGSSLWPKLSSIFVDMLQKTDRAQGSHSIQTRDRSQGLFRHCTSRWLALTFLMHLTKVC
ncbi:hypothetical protein IW136_002782, partial [Coemansia sp. RSA 678]